MKKTRYDEKESQCIVRNVYVIYVKLYIMNFGSLAILANIPYSLNYLGPLRKCIYYKNGKIA